MGALDGWIDIFRAGTWTDAKNRTVTLTEAQIDEIVSQYSASDPAPVCIGHPETDAPAFAWVAELRRTGDRLQAKLRDIAPEFRSMVEAGRYAGRSIALAADLTLRHLAFLGGRQPAVSGLAPSQFSGEAEHVIDVELASDGSLPTAREASLATRERAVQLAEDAGRIKDMLQPHIEAGRVLPGERDMLIALCLSMGADGDDLTFAYGGDENETAAPLDLFNRFLDALPARVIFSELAGGPMPPFPDTKQADMPVPEGFTISPEHRAAHDKAVALMESEDIDYITALTRIE